MNVGLAACEVVQHPEWIKKSILFIMIAAAQFHPPVVKNQVSTLFQGIRSTSLIEFPFSFYFDKSRKPSQRWVVSMRTKAEIAFWLGFWCSEMLISDIQKRPRQRLLHRKNRWSFCTFTELDFSAWQGCTGYRATLNVCTNIKKVDNHWTRWPPRSFANPICYGKKYLFIWLVGQDTFPHLATSEMPTWVRPWM